MPTTKVKKKAPVKKIAKKAVAKKKVVKRVKFERGDWVVITEGNWKGYFIDLAGDKSPHYIGYARNPSNLEYTYVNKRFKSSSLKIIKPIERFDLGENASYTATIFPEVNCIKVGCNWISGITIGKIHELLNQKDGTNS